MTVGWASTSLGGAGGPLAVLLIAIVAAELGKAVSKETKVDLLVTPLVTIFSGVGLALLIAAPIGAAASRVGARPQNSCCRRQTVYHTGVKTARRRGDFGRFDRNSRRSVQ